MRLYITGYSRVAYASNMHSLPAPHEPAEFNESLPISSVGAISKPFPGDTRFLCIVNDDPCWVAFGEDPVAVVGEHPLLAGEHFFGVFPGHRLAVISGDES